MTLLNEIVKNTSVEPRRACAVRHSEGRQLTEEDYEKLRARWITPELADLAGIRRVADLETRDIVGAKKSKGNYAGLLIPFARPGESHPHANRVRRDEPDFVFRTETDERPKEEKKYVAAPGSSNIVYFAPMTEPAVLNNTGVPVVITEGEFKTIALSRLSNHESDVPRWLSLGLTGVWNWKGVVGKKPGPNGDRRDVKGVIPDFDLVNWKDRDVIIAFDADAAESEGVRAARYALAAELRRRGARVALLEWSKDQGKGIDDHLAAVGPEQVLAEFDKLDFTTQDYVRSEKGAVLPILANVARRLEEEPDTKDSLSYNEFQQAPVFKADCSLAEAQAGQKLEDRHTRRIAIHLQAHGMPSVGIDLVGQALYAVSESAARRFHPVRDYLESLKWDGTVRLHTWLHVLLGSEQNEYTKAVGVCWLISAVARVMDPGCQADYTLVLEGLQGKKKSSLLRALAVRDEWFLDELPSVTDKDSKEALQGRWIVEIAELQNIRGRELGAVKSFLTRRWDKYRRPYGRMTVDLPRQCVFAGTTNEDTYLEDPTGNRRWWPVKATKIDFEKLKEIRDQLWAEALHRYRAGEPWWLNETTEALAEAEQAERYLDDDRQRLVEEWCSDPLIPVDDRYEGRNTTRADDNGALLSTRDKVVTKEILEYCLGLTPEKVTSRETQYVGKILRAMKWKRGEKETVDTDKPIAARRPPCRFWHRPGVRHIAPVQMDNAA